MKCSQCGYDDTKVIESRESSDGQAIRRRRACLGCPHRFTTYERIEQPQLVVVKASGSKDIFSRDKLFAGLVRACEKTSISTVDLEQIVSDVERQLYDSGETEVSSAKIGDIVLESLARKDEVAYIRFASVYKRFTDVESFEKELGKLKSSNK